MSSIGNDNFRPGLNPPRAVRGSWLTSNMAQLMVFLNGLILTVTAYATLSVFMQEIITDNLKRAGDQFHLQAKQNFQEVEKHLEMTQVFLSTSQSSNIESLKTKLGPILTELSLEDFLFMKFDSTYSLISAKRLITGEGLADEYYEEAIRQALRAKTNHSVSGAPAKAMRRANLSDIFEADTRPVIVANSFMDAQGHKNILLGAFYLHDVFDQGWLTKLPNVKHIVMRQAGGKPYLLDLVNTTIGKDVEPDFEGVYEFEVGGQVFELKLSMMVDKNQAFLTNIPLLMLLFGITLTLIGTLYVRNNQKQSLRLANMNRELAEKNFELNTQINEREKLNTHIQKSERENRALIDSVSDIIFETATNGDLIFLNSTWKKVTGFETEASIGRNLFSMLYPQDQADQEEKFQELVKGHRQAYRSYTRLRTSDGTFRAVELAFSMIRQDESKNLRVVGTVTDVEERRRAERALAEAEKKYRAIVENAAGGIYQMTPDGQYLSANPSMARILGYDGTEDILRDIRNANTQLYVDQSVRSKFLKDLEGTDNVLEIETQIRRKDGKLIWAREHVRSVKDDEGQVLYFEGAMEDVTDRKKAELALKEAKVQSDLSSRSKSEFLANMSHELRTPLNAIIGFSEIIKNEVFGPVGHQEYKTYATDIYDSGRGLLNIINDILDVSRIEAGDRQLNEGVVDLHKIVRDVHDLNAPKAQAAQLVLSNLVDQDTPKIIGEAHAIKQMMLNLVSNAIKFTQSGGRVTLTAEQDNKGDLRLSVTDTGVGLTEDEITKALAPFGQVNTELNRSDSGTGLGLTIVSSLIKLHGGELDLFSQKGIGTTATLIFPAKRVANTQNGEKPESMEQEVDEAHRETDPEHIS